MSASCDCKNRSLICIILSPAGQPGEQWTMFFLDPSGNALEFKAMTNPDNLFAKYRVD